MDFIGGKFGIHPDVLLEGECTGGADRVWTTPHDRQASAGDRLYCHTSSLDRPVFGSGDGRLGDRNPDFDPRSVAGSGMACEQRAGLRGPLTHVLQTVALHDTVRVKPAAVVGEFHHQLSAGHARREADGIRTGMA